MSLFVSLIFRGFNYLYICSFLLINTGRLTLWIVEYRILGLCNNFAYVIMLSAAHDILMPEANVRT